MPKITTTPGCFCCGPPPGCRGSAGCRGTSWPAVHVLVGWLAMVRTYSNHLCSSSSSFSQILLLLHVYISTNAPARSWLGAYLEASLTALVQNDGGVKKLQGWLYGRGRLSLASSQAGGLYGCFTQPNKNDLRLPRESARARLLALPLSPPTLPSQQYPLSHPRTTASSWLSATTEPLKATKGDGKGRRWKSPGGGVLGWEIHL